MARDSSMFVSLTTAPHRALAEPIAELLQDHGIHAWVKSDDCGGVDPALNFVNGTHVMVPRTDLEHGRELLAEFEAAAPMMPS